NMAHYEEYKDKYGDPFDENEDKTAASGWHPSTVSPLQQLWLRRSLTVFAAFMLACLYYSLLSKMASLPLQSLLPPNSWFIAVLSGIGLAATLGALMLNWNRRSEEHTSELQSRFDLVCRLLLEKKKK